MMLPSADIQSAQIIGFMTGVSTAWEHVFLTPTHDDLQKLWDMRRYLESIEIEKTEHSVPFGAHARCLILPSHDWFCTQPTLPKCVAMIYGIEKDQLADPFIWSLTGKEFFLAALNDLITQRNSALVGVSCGQEESLQPVGHI